MAELEFQTCINRGVGFRNWVRDIILQELSPIINEMNETLKKIEIENNRIVSDITSEVISPNK